MLSSSQDQLEKMKKMNVFEDAVLIYACGRENAPF